LWAALRFGPAGAVTATFLVWVAALSGTLAERGPFSLARGHDSLVLLQSFIGILAATGLVVAGATAERQQALDSMQALNQTLEARVADRSAELAVRAGQLRALAAQLTQVEQRERRRLATLLHDHLQQTLVAARLHVDHVRRRDLDETAEEGLTAVGDLLQQAITASRSLAVELSPPVLHDAGLVPALHWLARTVQTQYGLQVGVEVSGSTDGLDEDLGAFVFHSVRELLFNVVKHAGTDRARVTVSTGSSGHLRVEVADAGIGFDRTSRAETAVDRFGLLSIRERLEQLGGEFALETARGRGVSVTLTLPRIAAGDLPAAATSYDARSSAGPLPAPAATPASGIRVLLVDDHRIVREGLRLLLEEQPDMNVVGEAADGVEALDVARRVRPDVVLMDVNMPRMNGIECTRRIKQEHPQLAVIGLSFHQDGDVAASMRDAGAESYVRKDGPPGELCEAIRSIRFPAAPAIVPSAEIREA
jgi:signal transduction histidine kinase/CheY-like chemotaxis protein